MKEKLIRWIAISLLILSFGISSYAFFATDSTHEAPIGSFESTSFSEGWQLTKDGSTEEISLPFEIDAQKDEYVTISNTLPGDLSGNNSLMIRASMQDMYVYVDDELREAYSSDSNPGIGYYIPSAYVVTSLTDEDAGKDITIGIRFKTKFVINEVVLSPGNNAWFSVLLRNLPINTAAFLVLILGMILLVFSILPRRMGLSGNSPFYLSLLMIDLALWIFSESSIRQLIFTQPSLSRYFAYFTVETIGVFACMYFDAVQHETYHKRYLIAEIVSLSVVGLNLVLELTGVAGLYRTLPVSHAVMAASLTLAVVNIITDIRHKRIREYKATALGMMAFMISGVIELVLFYVSEVHILGIFICLGLVILMAATLSQTLIDQREAAIRREKSQRRNMINTIETIAGTIDAKDEYTGGHSDRVGRYAALLGRAMASAYHFSDEDIERIRYIGTMHDIGKIGVPDRVLNKPGKLDEDEFALMKKHVEIGAKLMSGFDEEIRDLRDGILYHHERFDGKGYPSGLAGTEIPLIARMICLADSYDAMTSDRVYRKSLSDEEVRSEIRRCSGTQFDPDLAAIFLNLLESHSGNIRLET